jgi:hypothetical protein
MLVSVLLFEMPNEILCSVIRKAQATSISRWVVTAGEGSSCLLLLSLIDMLQATGEGFGTY